MITKSKVKEFITKIGVRPVHDSLLVLVQKPSEVTAAGIVKGEEAMKEEALKGEQFMYVLAVSDDVTNIHPLDLVFVQGTVMAFTENQVTPKEFPKAPVGYALGLVPRMYVKMVI